MSSNLGIKFLPIALMVQMLTSCASANFEASSETQRALPNKNPEDHTPLIVPEINDRPPNLTPDNLQILTDCSHKAGQDLTSGSRFDIESTDIVAQITNKTQWQDTLATSTRPRVLIVNIRGQIANKLDLEFGNPNTTYCLNIKLQIVNSLNMRVSKTAKVIDVYDNQIMNHSNRSQI
jgi:hypothetical protein